MADEDLSLYAVLHELNGRAFRERIGRFPEALRYYVILADALVGLENSRRIGETPSGVIGESEQFVEKLKGMVNPSDDETFGAILLSCVLDSLKGELAFSCLNCRGFGECLQPGQLPVGRLFDRRVKGDETRELREEISRQVDAALVKIPYFDDEAAHAHCERFRHSHSVASLAGLFKRYSEIAGRFAAQYAFDYGQFLGELAAINMEFARKSEKLLPRDPS